MMSCGICGKWQHIICHDNADLRAGRSKRDWNVEEFVCQRCRSRAAQKHDGSYQQYQMAHPLQSQPRSHIQPVTNPPPRVHPAYTAVQPYPNSALVLQNGHDDFLPPTSSSMAQQRPYQPHAPITFAHYQPDPQGFSTRQTYQRDLPNPSQG